MNYTFAMSTDKRSQEYNQRLAELEDFTRNIVMEHFLLLSWWIAVDGDKLI